MFPLCFVLALSTAPKLLTQLRLYALMLMKLQPLQHSFCEPVTMAELLEP